MSDVSVESLPFAITIIECRSSRSQRKLITTSSVDDVKSAVSAAATYRSTAAAMAIDQQQESSRLVRLSMFNVICDVTHVQLHPMMNAD
jgi:hypothetical protein